MANTWALITGASSGVGREYAMHLIKTHNLFITGRDEKELANTKSLCVANSKNSVITLSGDLSSIEFLNELVCELLKLELDILVLNAGYAAFRNFIKSSPSECYQSLIANVYANVILSNQLIPGMLKKASINRIRAKIIITSSHAAFVNVPGFVTYCAEKSHLLSFGRSLACELRNDPIDILVSCPGAIQTQFSSRAGLPTKIFSKPIDAQRVVIKTLSIVGRRRIYFTNFKDIILYVFSRIIPPTYFDNFIAFMQKQGLKRKENKY